MEPEASLCSLGMQAWDPRAMSIWRERTEAEVSGQTMEALDSSLCFLSADEMLVAASCSCLSQASSPALKDLYSQIRIKRHRFFLKQQHIRDVCC